MAEVSAAAAVRQGDVAPCSWGLFVAAVIKVISHPCQQLLDAATAAASLRVLRGPQSVLRFETASLMLKVSEGLSRRERMISCLAGSDCLQRCGPLALCRDQLGPLYRRGEPASPQSSR